MAVHAEEIARLMSARHPLGTKGYAVSHQDGFSRITLLPVEEGNCLLEITISKSGEDLEFLAGQGTLYEGDYVQYPVNMEFIEDLIDAVLAGRVAERLYYFPAKAFGTLVKVRGEIEFKRFNRYEVNRALSVFGPLAMQCQEKRYTPYRKD
ncbi:MAG: hypothetical protein IPH83_06035 [Gammaproteobacteria bacterium]|nr:hypothetical protein [Gammaproteobacteria bacterium]